MVSLAPIGYFSMEIALESDVPTFSGGLGVLAGDTLRSAADFGLPMVGVTRLHRRGYIVQRLDAEGTQHEEPVSWPIEKLLEPTDGRCRVELERRAVPVRAWRYVIRGVSGSPVPVLLLDTDVPENDPRGSPDHRQPLWRRRAIPALPGGRPGHRRRA
jgi:starch phosphorylase